MSPALLLLALLLPSCATHRPPPLNPEAPEWSERAPAQYGVRLETTRGVILLSLDRSLAPVSADRFYNLVRSGYYDGVRFDRVIPGFVAQFGFAANPERTQAMDRAPIPSEPTRRTHARGTIAWTQSGAPNSRTTVVFVNLQDNPHLDTLDQTVFGEVTQGMELLDALPPSCPNMDQGRTREEGERYLSQVCPELLQIRRAVVTNPP